MTSISHHHTPSRAITDMRVVSTSTVAPGFTSLWLEAADGSELIAPVAGQFYEIAIPAATGYILRRPISVCDWHDGRLRLLVAAVGEGTRRISSLNVGDTLNAVGPLGRGFTLPKTGSHPLLVGGGVGVAPMYLLARTLQQHGTPATVITGARTAEALLLVDEMASLANEVLITTDNGSAGYHGRVTDHPYWEEGNFDCVYCCGPKPMMMAVAKRSRQFGVECEVSLENMMACGLGACLCCVEPTIKGNLCVCTDGPVFNINQLLW